MWVPPSRAKGKREREGVGGAGGAVFLQLLLCRTALERRVRKHFSKEVVLSTRLVELHQKQLRKLLLKLYQMDPQDLFGRAPAPTSSVAPAGALPNT
jgi:uncharacterized coiled-coil protein SlyX